MRNIGCALELRRGWELCWPGPWLSHSVPSCHYGNFAREIHLRVRQLVTSSSDKVRLMELYTYWLANLIKQQNHKRGAYILSIHTNHNYVTYSVLSFLLFLRLVVHGFWK